MKKKYSAAAITQEIVKRKSAIRDRLQPVSLSYRVEGGVAIMNFFRRWMTAIGGKPIHKKIDDPPQYERFAGCSSMNRVYNQQPSEFVRHVDFALRDQLVTEHLKQSNHK